MEAVLLLPLLFTLCFSSMKTKHEPYKTVLTISIGLVVVYFMNHSVYSLYLLCFVAGFSLLSERIANCVHVLWMKLAKLLSYVVPNILLSVIFFLILTPIALLHKLFHKNNSFNYSIKDITTFKEIMKKFDKPHFEKPW